MATSLTGLTPSTTYDALIKVGDNGPIDGTLKVLSDGLGNDLPIQASTTAVNFTGALTQSGNTLQPTLVSGTSIKTVNSTSLLGSGDIAVQPTLVSGTNIKTLNSVSLLGSGDIVLTANPSGVSGAIQFSNGSAFASDASNLFWDDTNNRLGIGTNAPSVPFEVLGNAWVNAVANADATFSIGNPSRRWDVKALQSGAYYQVVYNNGLIGQSIDYLGNVAFGNVATLGARLGIKGSGSTSATTSLLVQNSAGTERFKIQDDGTTTFNGGLQISTNGGKLNSGLTQMQLGTDAARAVILYSNNTSVLSSKYFTGNIGVVVSDSKSYGDASDIALNTTAVLQADSTTRGFLPPRGTNTQMNAIASPATGLVFYDTTNNKLCVYNATSWIPLH